MIHEAWLFITALVWWEYLLVAIAIISLFYAEYEENVIGFAIGFGLFMFYPWSNTGSLFSHVGFFGSIFWLGIYLIIGVFWSIFKWNRLTKKIIDESKDQYERYESIREEQTLEEYLKEKVEYEKSFNRFSYWISSWPISAFVYFFGEMFSDFFKKIVKYLSKFYTKIGERNIAKAIKKE